MAPEYLKKKIKKKKDIELRSDKKNKLFVPKSNMKNYGDRAFSVAGPILWNDLPDHLRLCTNADRFKRDLKTVLFRRAFNLN